MRDLVETIIGQTLQQKPRFEPPSGQSTTQNKSAHIVSPLEIKDPETWQACCQFEAIFLQQMMEAMRKTIPQSELMPQGYATQMYDGMMNQAIAESGSKSAPLGLAESMYRQLDRDGFTQTNATNQNIPQELQHIADSMNTPTQADMPKLGGLNG